MRVAGCDRRKELVQQVVTLEWIMPLRLDPLKTYRELLCRRRGLKIPRLTNAIVPIALFLPVSPFKWAIESHSCVFGTPFFLHSSRSE